MTQPPSPALCLLPGDYETRFCRKSYSCLLDCLLASTPTRHSSRDLTALHRQPATGRDRARPGPGLHRAFEEPSCSPPRAPRAFPPTQGVHSREASPRAAPGVRRRGACRQRAGSSERPKPHQGLHSGSQCRGSAALEDGAEENGLQFLPRDGWPCWRGVGARAPLRKEPVPGKGGQTCIWVGRRCQVPERRVPCRLAGLT